MSEETINFTEELPTDPKPEDLPRQPRKISPLVRRVLTCVPKQLHDTQEKLDWVERMIDEHKPHIFITPQEMWGGCAMQPHHPFVKEEELLPQLLDLTKRKGIGMVAGVVEADNGSNRERLWFLDEGKLIGKISKFALPRYSRKGSKGSYETVEEGSLQNRFVKFPVQGIDIAGFFCWEIFSSALIAGLRQIEPDLVVGPIKFGPAAYPSYTVREDGKIWANVGKFNYMSWGKDLWMDPWMDKLRIAANYDLLCPVAVSCNTWHCRGRSRPPCGIIWDTDQITNIWIPDDKLKANEIPEKVIVTEYDFNRVRASRKGKWGFYELCDCHPPSRLLQLTMLYKMKAIEKKRIRGDAATDFDSFELA